MEMKNLLPTSHCISSGNTWVKIVSVLPSLTKILTVLKWISFDKKILLIFISLMMNVKLLTIVVTFVVK